MHDADGVPLEELVELPELYHPAVSPDGSQVAVYYDGTGRNELHLIDRETGAMTRLTDGEVPRDASWYPRWAASGDRLFFHKDAAGDEQNDVYAVSLDGGVDLVADPDGQAIVLDSTPSFLLYSSDAGEQLNLYRQDLDGGEPIRLTDHDQPVRGARIGPDGDRIAYVANESDTLKNRDLYVMAADGSDRRRVPVGEDGSETGLGAWFPDGARVLVSDDAEDLARVGVLDLADETVDWLGPHEHDETAIAVAPDGETVLATRHRHGATVAVAYDVASGEGRELALPGRSEGVVQFELFPPGRVFADDSTVVFAHSTPAERRAVYEYDLATDEARVLLDPEYGDVDPDSLVDAEYVTYQSEDGLEIGGLLFDPRDGPARAADAVGVPGVVMVHGGPHFRASRRFNLYVQFLVSRGYAVFQPNYRGSTGRGRAFEEAIHGDWGGLEQADVAAGGRWLMDRDWVDGDRVAVFGGSYGGYSVYCQLTQYPRLWATGIAWMGITDLHRLFEDDMPHFQHQLLTQMGDPEENHELWRERSPIEHADAMERPVCMIHGVNDPRCPVIQARLFRDALEERSWEAGEDFEYHELGAEGHGSTDVEQKIRVFQLFENYLERWL